MIPGVLQFVPLGKFQHNIEIYIRASCVSRLSFRFLSSICLLMTFVTKKIHHILQKTLDFPKLTEAKSEIFKEAIWPTLINRFFKSPPPLAFFCQINYLFEISLGYPNYPIQKGYIWASFQTSKKRFCKLQKAICITVINEIFKVTPHFDLFCQVNSLYDFFSSFLKDATQKMIHSD